MANKINKKSFHERYALLLDKYPKTLEWVRHKARWELMHQEDSGDGNVKTPDEIQELENRIGSQSH